MALPQHMFIFLRLDLLMGVPTHLTSEKHSPMMKSLQVFVLKGSLGFFHHILVCDSLSVT